MLDSGQMRVAEPKHGDWVVNEWVKKAILLYFVMKDMRVIKAEPFEYNDKMPLKAEFAQAGIRVVPGAIVRYGSFLEKGVILMPDQKSVV